MRSITGNCILLILMGASASVRGAGPAPTDFPPTSDHHAGADWWALQPIARPATPAVGDGKWCRESIDAFVLARLEARNLHPSPEADRRTLIRRVSFDLIGLPPTPEEIEGFLHDESADAYEKLVDRLLASPHYGEQWARHWLDVVRFGESEGFEHNRPRPNAWRYRDWVIDAFNGDMPYDRFVREQIAGDVLAPNDPMAVTATGYLVCGSYDSLGLEKGSESMVELTRQDHVENVVGNLGQTFLGLTVNCSRCHDHKFDPIRQMEFYQLAAALAGVGVGERDTVADPSDSSLRAERESLAKQIQEAHQRMAPLDGAIRQRLGEKLLASARAEADSTRKISIADVVAEREAASIAAALRGEGNAPANDEAKKRSDSAQATARNRIDQSAKSRQLAAAAAQALAELIAAGPASRIAYAQVLAEMPAAEREKYAPFVLEASQLELRARLLAGGKAAAVVSEKPRVVHVLLHGDIHRPGEVACARGLAAVGEISPDFGLAADSPEAQRRAKLAQWITDPKNPLPARVIVNRLWHYHFAAGIVRTPSDFGFNGGRPSHRELLDFLASELIDHGWSLKHVQRLIVLSATYRQGVDISAAASDPDNRWLSHRAPERLEAEAVRDAMLQVSGELNAQMGGPGYEDTKHEFRDNDDFYLPLEVSGPEFDRRSIYRSWHRAGFNPFLETLDCPDPSVSTPARSVTLTPLQALSLLNGALTGRLSGQFAHRVEREAGADVERQIDRCYRLALGRAPAADEIASARTFITDHGLGQFCLVLFNSSEFLYVD